MIYDCGDMSFIFSNSKPFHCLFILFSQIWPKLNTFIVSYSKTRKYIDLKSSGNPPDEIFTAIRVFGIVRNEYKWSVVMETTKNQGKPLKMYS